MYDVLIIGCGVVGAATAYYLSKYNLSVCVCERYNDVANGCTKANTAILHAGFDCPIGSEEAKLNIRGINLAKVICKKLDVERISMPTFIIAYDNPHELNYLRDLCHRGEVNGAEGVRIVDRETALKMEPALNPKIKAALYAPGSAIINPWDYCIAMAETAVRNGIEINLDTKVLGIQKQADGTFTVKTNHGIYATKYVINAAGGWSAEIYRMVGGNDLYQTNFAGQYFVLDKSEGEKLHSIVFPCPDKHGFKGICVTPTIHGNVLVGPDAYNVANGDQVGTNPVTLQLLKENGHRSVPSIDFGKIIHEYAGVRPNTQIPDFVIGESPICKHFINLAGIKSPGLSSAPAIAEEAVEILSNCGLQLVRKKNFVDERHVVRLNKLSVEERNRLIHDNPKYGRIICRCENISEGEIIDAIHRPIIPKTIDAVKRRCNTGMGRCQGAFCGPRIHEILVKSLGLSPEEVLMDEQGSYIVTSSIKEASYEE